MTDWLSVMERGLKAVRYGIFRANDNLAYLLEGLCCAPEESNNCGSCGRPKDAAHRPDCRNPDAREFAFDDVPTVHLPDSAASPQVAVVAPSPKQGSDSGPADSDILTSPAGPHPHADLVQKLEEWADYAASAARDCAEFNDLQAVNWHKGRRSGYERVIKHLKTEK